MASKKDLVEGQAFSRRRLITAFVSGAPGGREVEPGKPLRAVVGGIVLSAILVVGALAAGLLSPTLPDGWDQGSLVIAKDTGARYVAIDGTLYPVINTASARLLIPSGFKVVSADADKFTDSKRGQTLGIIGAPDALPSPSTLVDTGWTACTSQQLGVDVSIERESKVRSVTDQALFATVATGDGNVTYLVDNGFRFKIPTDLVNSVKLTLGLASAPDYTVDAAWMNLFAAGPDLPSFEVPGKGGSLAGTNGLPPNAQIGSVVADSENTDSLFILLAGGEIAPLDPFAAAMYRIGGTAGDQAPLPIEGQVFSALPLTQKITPEAWPTRVPGLVDRTPCAVLSAGTGGVKPEVMLGVTTDPAPANGITKVTVDAGGGALVRGIGAANLTNGSVFLVDQTGTAFPVQGNGEDDPLGQLGFSTSDIVPVPQAWTAILETGPTLSVAAAQTAISSATGR